jgi:hypothetical protein
MASNPKAIPVAVMYARIVRSPPRLGSEMATARPSRCNLGNSLATILRCALTQDEAADPFGFVHSGNLLRRHSSESQRALGAARLARLPRGWPTNACQQAFTQEEAADWFGVGRSSVQCARIVARAGRAGDVAAVDAVIGKRPRSWWAS